MRIYGEARLFRHFFDVDVKWRATSQKGNIYTAATIVKDLHLKNSNINKTGGYFDRR